METQWRIELLGGLRAVHASQVLSRFQTQKIGLLLAYLAYYPHRSHQREALIELFWPECESQAGRNNLSVSLSWLRRQLEPRGPPAGSIFMADRASVQLNPEAVTTDVAELQATLQAAKHAAGGVEQTAFLAQAVDLYRGELLPGSFDDWVLQERQWLAERYFQALGQLLAHLERAREFDRALEYARRGVSADPLREEAHRDLIRLLAAASQPGAALHQYEALERLLARELAAEPAPEIRALAREIRRQRVGVQDPQVPDASPLLTGTVTFLLTEPGDEMLLRPLFRGYGGQEVPTTGEGGAGGAGLVARFLATFGRASDALAAAVAAQRAPAGETGRRGLSVPRMRMALQTGEVEPGEEVQHCPVLQHATRLLLSAHPGQILLSEETATLLRRDPAPDVRLLDLGLYRLQEEAAPEHLFQAQHPDLASQAFPPPNAPSGPVGNLPLPLTRFFGRRTEIARLRELLLTARTRLVTLTGPGGSGKTRLALEAARRLRGSWQGGIWFVPLADLADPRLIAEKVRDALQLPRAAQLEPLEQVLAALSGQRALVLLDNFEQLVPGGVPLVETLLEQVEHLTVVITSRQRLGLGGERAFPVPPLPAPGEAETPERLQECASVRLFVDRAQAVWPEFQVTERNAAAVAGLCQRLEGLPLALELAAARAGVLTPAQMLSRLAQRFELLVSRKREADPRHQSLQAALDWSYRLLSPELQRFLAQQSVFRGGWTLEAAETVCEEPRALEHLEQLRDGSLVLAEAGEERLHPAEVYRGVSDGGVPPGPPRASAEARRPERVAAPGEEGMRYRLLETLREYGAGQLCAAERTALAQRHAAYYLALAERAEPELTGPAQGAWLARLDREHDNLRAALAWSVESGEAERGLRLAAALGLFWWGRGHWSDGRRWLETMLSGSGGAAVSVRAKALYWAGTLAVFQRDCGTARALFEENLALCREVGDKRGTAWALHGLGRVAESEGEYETMRALNEEGLAMFQETGDKWGMTWSLDSLGSVAQAQRDYEAARVLFEEGLALCRELGDKRGVAWALHILGDVARDQGDSGGARALWEESVALFRELEDKGALIHLLGSLGHLTRDQGDYGRARALYRESLARRREVGDTRALAQSLEDFASLASRQGQVQRAAQLFGMAEALREAIRAPLSPYDHAESQRHVAAARAALSEEAFAAAWAEGRTMTLEQALAYAAEDEARPQ